MYQRIQFDIHLRQHKKHTVCLCVVLKATGGRKSHRKGNCVSRIQFSQGYSFEVARYSTVTHFQMLKSARS